MSALLPRVEIEKVARPSRRPVDPKTLEQAARIVESVRDGGHDALRAQAERLGDLDPGQPFVKSKEALGDAFSRLDAETAELLERVAGRIQGFARAQKDSMMDISLDVPGGVAGHYWVPVRAVGAYAPGGRHPLPSTALMTVIPARVAGVDSVWVASPRASAITMAACHVAGADGLISVGGAQAIAALAFGISCPSSDLVVGPGNKWVTAAKKHLYGEIGIDGLAGPSEIVVIGDGSADPALVAADLLAQAEHDPEAVPILISTVTGLIEGVESALGVQIRDLPTAAVARGALANGFATLVPTLQEAASLSDEIGPEHLALHVEDPDGLRHRLNSYGSVFVGAHSAETFADYGAGPNHVLPTGGGARYQAGLSVHTFLRSPTWLQLTDIGELVDDTVRLARLEGLEAHARAALIREA